MKAKTLGMLFSTGLFAVSLAIGAPRQDTSQQNQGATDQTQQQATPTDQSQAQQGTMAPSQQTTTTAQAPSTTGKKKLPRTASEAPLLGLLGLIALGGAAGARILNKRTA